MVDSRGAGMQLPCPFCEKPVTIPKQSEVGQEAKVNGALATAGVSAGVGVGNGHASYEAPPASNGGGTQPATEQSADYLEQQELAWTDDDQRDPARTDEIRRLAAMMRPDENFLAPAVVGKRGMISFRCPSCGQVMSAKRSNVGDIAQCVACAIDFEIPDFKQPDSEEETKPARGALPARRNQALRTADDLRKSAEPQQAPSSSSADTSLDIQFQDLIRRELEKLQGGEGQTASSNATPSAKGRKKPPPPLAEHGEVVPVRPASEAAAAHGEGDRQGNRTSPHHRPNAPLPPLVAMDTMDLDSEVAKQWGEQAVVQTSRLNWVAILVILGIMGAGIYYGYEYFTGFSEEQAAPAVEAESGGDEVAPGLVADTLPRPEVVLPTEKIIGSLRAFHDAVSPEAKVIHVREPDVVLPLMKAHYLKNDVESRLINQDSLTITPQRIADRTFYLVKGEYEDFQPFHADLEETPDGRFLLDWKSWIGYSEVPWAEFERQGLERASVYRVWVEVQEYYNYTFIDAAKYRSYLLRDKNDTVRLFGYALNDSPTGERLAELFKELKDADKRQKARLMVSLRYDPATDKSKGQVLIDELVNEHWVAID